MPTKDDIADAIDARMAVLLADAYTPHQAAIRANLLDAIATGIVAWPGTGGGGITGPGTTVAGHVVVWDSTDGTIVDDGGALGTAAAADVGDFDPAGAAADVEAAITLLLAGYQLLSEKGAASGYPRLNGSGLVVEKPADATATPTANKIPISDGFGKLDGWISTATTATYGLTELSASTPQPLGSATAGASGKASDAAHVHAMPSATDVGALHGALGSTDNALLRADGTGGQTAQGSVPILSDAGALAGLTGVTSTGTVDLSGASSLLVPASAGAAPTAAESVAYDSTRKVLVHGDGSTTHVVYSGILPYFGAGLDGAIDFDGTSTITLRGAFIVPAAGVYTLTRMISASSIRIRSGVTVQVGQFVILCTGTLTFDDATAKITENGNAAVGKTAGGNRAAGNITQSAFAGGAAGRSTAGAGANGNGITQSQGGSGGDGGAVTGFAGGSGGVATIPPANTSYATDLLGPIGYRWAAGSPGGPQGGAGGASGASLVNSNSGGGGSGGGYVFVAAVKIVGAGVIEAKGGNGADATIGTGLGAGGGGGGGGGQILVLTVGVGYTFTTAVSGGVKGVGVGATGTDGVNGSAGIATVISL